MTKYRTVLLLLQFVALILPLGANREALANPDTSERQVAGVAESDAAKIGQIVRDCPDCPEMVAVPQVGHSASDPGKIFYAGRFEVTWKEYLAAVREGACPVPAKSFGGFYDINDPRIDDNYPITRISPDTFNCYLKWLRQKTGNTYRIPSAPEWEHVARAGTSTNYYWGDEIGHDNAIVAGYFDREALKIRLGYPRQGRDDPRLDSSIGMIFPVGQFEKNPWGLYDVIGNAGEITSEVYPISAECINRRSVKDCSGLYARGIGQPRFKNEPLIEPLSTARYQTPEYYGAIRMGFRVFRD